MKFLYVTAVLIMCGSVLGLAAPAGRRSAGIEWVYSRPAGIEFTRSEVTVGQYRACVKAGKCSAPKSRDVNSYCNWGYPDRDAHPVNCVDWNQATGFCKWAGGRLPTEKEWVAEASNGGKRRFPWGNQAASCKRAVFSRGGDGCGKNSTWPVCSKPAGNSVSGLCDLSGNIWEWTATLKTTHHGQRPVLRGASWNVEYPELLQVAKNQIAYPPNYRNYYVGFRCGREPR